MSSIFLKKLPLLADLTSIVSKNILNNQVKAMLGLAMGPQNYLAPCGPIFGLGTTLN